MLFTNFKYEDFVLSREQMLHLYDLEINTSNAHMAWSYVSCTEGEGWTVRVRSLVDKSENYIPTFLLQDILDVLPRFIEFPNTNPKYKGLDTSRLSIDIQNNRICYKSWHLDDHVNYAASGNTLLEAAYKTLCWCKKNNYI